MIPNPNKGRIQGGDAAKGNQQRSKPLVVQASAKPTQPPDALSTSPHPKALALPRRVKLFSNLALAALLGTILLTLSLWLGDFRLPFLPTVPDQPSLSISSGPYRVGNTVQLQGRHFSPYTIIVLLLDGQPATDGSGLRLSVDSDAQGTFTTTLLITPDWGLGEHILGAKDTTSGQQALINISVESAISQRSS